VVPGTLELREQSKFHTGHIGMVQAVRPIKDQVLVKQDPSQERVGREGLLWAPQGQEYWPSTGTVVDVGPGKHNQPMDEGLAPGTRVLFKRRPMSALIPDTRLGGPEEFKGLLMLREEDILGIIEEE